MRATADFPSYTVYLYNQLHTVKLIYCLEIWNRLIPYWIISYIILPIIESFIHGKFNNFFTVCIIRSLV